MFKIQVKMGNCSWRDLMANTPDPIAKITVLKKIAVNSEKEANNVASEYAMYNKGNEYRVLPLNPYDLIEILNGNGGKNLDLVKEMFKKLGKGKL